METSSTARGRVEVNSDLSFVWGDEKGAFSALTVTDLVKGTICERLRRQ